MKGYSTQRPVGKGKFYPAWLITGIEWMSAHEFPLSNHLISYSGHWKLKSKDIKAGFRQWWSSLQIARIAGGGLCTPVRSTQSVRKMLCHPIGRSIGESVHPTYRPAVVGHPELLHIANNRPQTAICKRLFTMKFQDLRWICFHTYKEKIAVEKKPGQNLS
jgi:hypothetical protein